MSGLLRIAVVAGLAASAAAQTSGWLPGQVNATMCYWEQPRAAVVRDTLFIDGGNLWWIPGMNDGSYGSVSNDANPLGIVWTLNFSVPFATSDNVTADMGMLYKVPAGSSANNVAPNYLDGAMLANDEEWFLYGGLLANTDQFSLPDADAAQLYQEYQYGADKPAFRPGFINVDLPSTLTRYVAYGGAASAPSENKAWYFSGLRAPSYGPIYTVTGNDSLTAVNVSNTLITVDMAEQNSETWTNDTLPSSVTGRANPELVWVPIGAQGLLVAIGGVLDPQWVSVVGKSENAAASMASSPAFVTTIDVYDVASSTWYKQPTTGGSSIGQRTRACAVVATAQDASSFNIYYYGGFDGLNVGGPFNDDVWVLSLPSFTWTQVYTSTDASTHGRAGHKCVAPYPDQMFVVGGYTPKAGNGVGCLGGGVVQLFNLSSATWMTSYTPTKWANYVVPDAVVKVIGGSGTGGATATAPAASGGWADAALKAVFATPYPTSKLTHYYPYPLNTTGDAANNTNPAAPTTSSGSHTPAFVAPLVGVLGGLIVVALVAVGILVYRRRRQSGSGGHRSSRGTGPVGGSGHPGTESVATYDTGRNFVFSWLRAQPSVKHASTPAASSYDDPHSNGYSTNGTRYGPHSTGTPISPEMEQLQMANAAAVAAGKLTPDQQGYYYGQQAAVAPAVEAENTYISEMIADTKYRAELPGSDLSTDAASASTRFTRGTGATYHGGVSSSAELESPLNPPQQVLNRADSPSLGQPPQLAAGAAAAPHLRESGVSDLSDQDRRHLRQGSEDGQSTMSGVSSSVVGSNAGTGGAGGSYSNLNRVSGDRSGAVSPLGSQFPAFISGQQPQPIPEAAAGAEAAAEAAAQPTPLQSSSQTSLPTPGSAGGDSTGQLRQSAFRESDADLRE